MKKLFARLKKFFSAETGEIVGAYFDGGKIFLVRLTENFEQAEVEADDAEPEHLAEKISLVCAKKNWKTSAVGFCLREEDAVTFQSDAANVPEKEFAALVKSWAMAQAGADAKFSFATNAAGLWMETLPREKVREFVAAFKKFGINLRALSVMPVDLLAKIFPFERAQFICEIVREKKSPNLLSSTGGVWNLEKIPAAVAAIFFIGMIFFSAKTFWDLHSAEKNLDAAKISVEKIREDLDAKKNLDADTEELKKIFATAAQLDPEKNFNFLINLGKISEGDVRLTKIRAEENFLEIEGVAGKPDAVRNYLARVRNSVVQSAQLEKTSERDDGEIVFVIRAELK